LIKRSIASLPLAICEECGGILLPKEGISRRRGFLTLFGPDPEDWQVIAAVVLILLVGAAITVALSAVSS
jgi:hypothetical protein